MLPGMLHKEKKVEVPRSFKRVNYSIKAKESSNRSMFSSIHSPFTGSPAKTLRKRNAFQEEKEMKRSLLLTAKEIDLVEETK